MFLNDNDRACCSWLRRLFPRSAVSVADVRALEPEQLGRHDRVHLFAGIGGWEYALRLAGWPAGRTVWTGSCPCQPFSTAGKRKAHADERHLWPEMLRLLAECRPPVVFGEQVASKLGRDWLAGVRADLENLGYRVGAADLCAAGCGAPHIRQRLFWVAYAPELRRGSQRGAETSTIQGQCAERSGSQPRPDQARQLSQGLKGRGRAGGLADAAGDRRRKPQPADLSSGHDSTTASECDGATGGLADAPDVRHRNCERRPCARTYADPLVPLEPQGCDPVGGVGNAERAKRRQAGGGDNISNGVTHQRREATSIPGVPSTDGFWSDFDLAPCRDGKIRRVPALPQPLVRLLADGLPDDLAEVWLACCGGWPLAGVKVPGRVKLLRGFGNSIVPAVAAVFIRSFLQAEEELSRA